MLDFLLNFLNVYAVPFVIRLVCAAVVLFVGFKLTKLIIKKVSKCNAFCEKLDSNVQALIKNTVKVLAYSIVIILAVEILGIPSATIVAVLGSCGLAIGLALQGGLSNIAGGVIIMLFKPFHEGDFISTPLGDGSVVDIGIFYTKLLTPDNVSINIPNSSLANSNISNYSEKDTRRVDVSVSVAYDSDIDLAKKVLLASAESHDLVLGDPAPVVFVTAQGDSAITIQVRAWTKSENYWAVKFDLLEDTKKVLDKFNINIPYPQLDVHVKND